MASKSTGWRSRAGQLQKQLAEVLADNAALIDQLAAIRQMREEDVARFAEEQAILLSTIALLNQKIDWLSCRK